MDRFRDASKDIFDRHFDDEFVADRFGWVQDAMFLVMVLNYFDLSAKKEVYPELAIAPEDGAKVAVQADSRLAALDLPLSFHPAATRVPAFVTLLSAV